MKKLFKSVLGISAIAALAPLAACNSLNASDYGFYDENYMQWEYDETGNYDHDAVIEHGFKSVAEEPSSYFSLDANTATYSLVRKQINGGMKIAPDSVRIEEMINYFDYSFTAPEDKAVNVEGYLSDCPWNAGNKLLLAGIKTKEYDLADKRANYVFLIDVSGSMEGDDRIDLAKYGMNELVDGLDGNDVVSLTTYASGVDTLFAGKPATAENKVKMKKSINSLYAHGATSGENGLQRAYDVAERYFIEGGNNRIILITDGDFNVGIDDPTQLKEYVQDKAESGVYLSVFGVGMGNMRDNMLETLARNGNGNYAYLDTKTEAKRVFTEKINSTLVTVAKDCKAGVTFSDGVESYRLIGYDTKIISSDEFDDERTDAGEIGSNLCVAALYEIKLSDTTTEKLADIEVKYKDVQNGNISDSVSCEVALSSPTSEDLSFISCVAEFGLLLRQSAYKGDASAENVIERLNGLSTYLETDVYKQEFKTLVAKACERENLYW